MMWKECDCSLCLRDNSNHPASPSIHPANFIQVKLLSVWAVALQSCSVNLWLHGPLVRPLMTSGCLGLKPLAGYLVCVSQHCV